MTEPTLERGQTWQEFIEQRQTRRAEIEVAMGSAEIWERDEMKSQLSEIWYALECAYHHLGAEPPEMDF